MSGGPPGIVRDWALLAGIPDPDGVAAGCLGPVERLVSLIEGLDTEDRRNPYQLTAVGAKALRARLASMQSVAKVGQRRLAKA